VSGDLAGVPPADTRGLAGPALRDYLCRIYSDKLVDSRPSVAAQRIRKLGFDSHDQLQAAENERAVELDQARARSDFRHSRVARIDATHANERERTFHAHIGFSQHPRR